MKMILIALALFSQIAKAEDFRTWTEASTKRTIEARMEKKNDEDGTVTLKLKNLKTVKLKVSKLIQTDQDYIKEWVEFIVPRDQLTVRIVKSGISRGKRVEVEVQAGKLDVKVNGPGLTATVKAGQKQLFQVEVKDRYTFTLTDLAGNIIDQESALKKTGRTKSR